MKEKRTLRWQTGKAHRPPPWVLTTTLASGPGRAEITDQGVFPFHPLAKPGRSLGACCFAQGMTGLAQEGGCCGGWAGDIQAVGEPARQPESK